MERNKNNEKCYIKRIDNKSSIKRKYKLIIEEEYQYTTDIPDDIARIINSYVNYTQKLDKRRLLGEIPQWGIFNFI